MSKPHDCAPDRTTGHILNKKLIIFWRRVHITRVEANINTTTMITAIALATTALVGCQGSKMTQPVPAAKSIYEFTLKDIDGKDVPLKKYKGKVLLIVNVASKCGLTPQYEGIQAAYKKYQKEGLVVLGFPANNFMGQEPGTNEEIKTFCNTKYNVTFPMFSKVSVKGDDINPLYAWLISHSGRLDDIEWNFAKFVIGKDGQVSARLAPGVTPTDPKFAAAIESALKS